MKGCDYLFKFSELVSKVSVKKLDSSNEKLVEMIMKQVNGQKIINTQKEGIIMFFNKKELTPSMMIDNAVGIVDSAVTAFKIAVAKIDQANEMLAQSKEQSQAKIEALEQELLNHKQVKEDAEAKINSHLELRDKLSQFVM